MVQTRAQRKREQDGNAQLVLSAPSKGKVNKRPRRQITAKGNEPKPHVTANESQTPSEVETTAAKSDPSTTGGDTYTTDGIRLYVPSTQVEDFKVAVVVPKWRESNFHAHAIRNYLAKSLEFPNQAIPAEWWVEEIAKIADYKPVQFQPRRGVCDLCNEPRYVSRKLTMGGQTYVLGPHCCERIGKVFVFYREMDRGMQWFHKSIETYYEDVKKYLDKLLIV